MGWKNDGRAARGACNCLGAADKGRMWACLLRTAARSSANTEHFAACRPEPWPKNTCMRRYVGRISGPVRERAALTGGALSKSVDLVYHNKRTRLIMF